MAFCSNLQKRNNTGASSNQIAEMKLKELRKTSLFLQVQAKLYKPSAKDYKELNSRIRKKFLQTLQPLNILKLMMKPILWAMEVVQKTYTWFY